MFTQQVNAVFINRSFNCPMPRKSPPAADPHESMIRLLAYAREATATKASPLREFKDLREALNVTSGRFTNWLSRGISKEGAIQAEALLGCSSAWLLTGFGQEQAGGHKVTESHAPYRDAGSPPPLPPKDFADRESFSESDWLTLNAVKLFVPEAQLEEMKKRYQQFFKQNADLIKRQQALALKAQPIPAEASSTAASNKKKAR